MVWVSSLENPKTVTQLRALGDFLQRHSDALARQGAIQSTYRKRGARRFGPYYRIIFRCAGGRQETFYLGRAGPLVRAASAELRALQKARRHELRSRRRERATRCQLRRLRHEVDRLLRRRGLHLKGYEVRGWRALRVKEPGAAAARDRIWSADVPHREERNARGTASGPAPNSSATTVIAEE